LRRRAAAFCFWAALALLVTNLLSSMLNAGTPPPQLPPAGHALSGTAPFTFAVMGDSQGNQSVFELVLERAQREGVQLMLHTGDIARRLSRREFDWVLHELSEMDLRVPFCAVPGNHDVEHGAGSPDESCRFYSRAFGPRRYWFSWGGVLFVAFDNSSKACRPEDLDWLEGTLERHRAAYRACFVFMHVPPRDPRPGKTHALEGGADELMAILSRHQVSAVFAGHIHAFLEDEVAGTPVYISGGAGGHRVPPISSHHFLLCTVEQDGSLTVERRDVEWVADADELEYRLRTRFPGTVALGAAGLLVAAGFCLVALDGRLAAHRPARRRMDSH
jgi:Icc-related predicted phosphoesterase